MITRTFSRRRGPSAPSSMSVPTPDSNIASWLGPESVREQSSAGPPASRLSRRFPAICSRRPSGRPKKPALQLARLLERPQPPRRAHELPGSPLLPGRRRGARIAQEPAPLCISDDRRSLEIPPDRPPARAPASPHRNPFSAPSTSPFSDAARTAVFQRPGRIAMSRDDVTVHERIGSLSAGHPYRPAPSLVGEGRSPPVERSMADAVRAARRGPSCMHFDDAAPCNPRGEGCRCNVVITNHPSQRNPLLRTSPTAKTKEARNRPERRDIVLEGRSTRRKNEKPA